MPNLLLFYVIFERLINYKTLNCKTHIPLVVFVLCLNINVFKYLKHELSVRLADKAVRLSV